FLYGAVCAAPAVMLTSLIQNKYLVLCIPFFLKYVANQTCTRIRSQVIENPEKLDMKFQKAGSIVNPDALADLSSFGEDRKLVLFYNASIVVLLFIIYVFIQNRRLDSGE
ncbi:MAG: hypothetical protein K2J67_08185, partial [Lachnospiraceae bacterium]|nr:hypothetical protein [Lachnospiraceae bacterium]